MLTQVGEEVAYGNGNFRPKFFMWSQLVIVGVEGPVGGVKDLGAQAGQMHLGHVSEAPRDGIIGVLHV